MSSDKSYLHKRICNDGTELHVAGAKDGFGTSVITDSAVSFLPLRYPSMLEAYVDVIDHALLEHGGIRERKE